LRRRRRKTYELTAQKMQGQVRVGMLSLALLAATLVVSAPGGAQEPKPLDVCPGCTYETIGATVAAARDGDVIQVRAAELVECDILVDKNVTVEGYNPADPDTPAIVNCDRHSNRVFVIPFGVSVLLLRLDIRGARMDVQVDTRGAGIFNQGCLTLQESFVRNNRFAEGAGIGGASTPAARWSSSTPPSPTTTPIIR